MVDSNSMADSSADSDSSAGFESDSMMGSDSTLLTGFVLGTLVGSKYVHAATEEGFQHTFCN